MKNIVQHLVAEAASGKTVFSTNMDIALRVRRALDDPDASLDQIATLIRADPLLAARTVAVANSVVYNRAGTPVTDVQKAIAWVGLRALSGVVMSVVVRQMHEAPAALNHRALAAALWDHTAHVASLAYVLATRVTHVDPNVAFFAGIVHEVGGFYLISRAASFPGLLDGPLQGWYREGEVRLGRAVLRAIEVPQVVLDAIDAHWKSRLGQPPTSLGDTLRLAVLLAPDSPLDALAEADDPVADQQRIDAELSYEALDAIQENSAAEVASLVAALKS